MAGREDEHGDVEPGGVYDDWFDEPEVPQERRRRGQRRSPDTSYEDAWVFPDDEEREPRRGPREPIVIAGITLTPVQLAIVGVSAVAILIAILAAAGAFSGSKPVATPPPTATQTKPTTTTAPVTTPVTKPKPTVIPPTSTLKSGDSGPQVTLLQKALTSLGFSVGKADGSYGPATKQAVTDFQNSKELTADGIFGPGTLAALTSALTETSTGSTGTTPSTTTTSTAPSVPTIALKPGDTGAQVMLLQQDLQALGYLTSAPDGTYGPATKAAVQAFQSAQGLGADGVTGAKTLAALQQALTATG